MKKFIKKALSVLMAVTMLGAVIGHAALTTPKTEGTLAYVTDFQADDANMGSSSIKFLTGFCAGGSGVGSPILSDRTNTNKWVATINESGTTKLTGLDFITVPLNFKKYITAVDVETAPIVSFKVTEAKKVYVAVLQGDGPTDWLSSTKGWTRTDATFVINESKSYDVWAKDYEANSTVKLGRVRAKEYYPYIILFGEQSAVVEPDEPDEPDEPADEMSAVTFNTEALITNIPYVSDVKVVSGGVTSGWRAETLGENGRTIADRTPSATNKSHKIVTADESLIGMDYITMPMNMKNVTSNPMVKFTVNKETVVRIAVRDGDVPSWITSEDSGWVKENKEIKVHDASDANSEGVFPTKKMNVYAKSFESGSTVELGGSGSWQPYMILLKAKSEISIENQAASLAENNVTVTADLTSAFGSETGLVIAALYDGDGAFVDTKYVSETVAVGTPADIELTFENVPELKSGAKVKLMFCDSFMSITPICASVDAAIN